MLPLEEYQDKELQVQNLESYIIQSSSCIDLSMKVPKIDALQLGYTPNTVMRS